MKQSAHRRSDDLAALCRLRSLASLSDEGAATVVASASAGRYVPARRELLSEGKPIVEPLMLLDGWAARVRHLFDGRRQFVGFVLSGELIGNCGFDDAIASCTIVTLTEARVCALPAADDHPDLKRIYAISRALDEAYLMAHITRIGRLDARERMLDMFLELYERLAVAGLTEGDGFVLPLTQEMLADALGLTSVHVNRMVQLARGREELVWSGKVLKLLNPEALSAALGRAPIKVS